MRKTVLSEIRGRKREMTAAVRLGLPRNSGVRRRSNRAFHIYRLRMATTTRAGRRYGQYALYIPIESEYTFATDELRSVPNLKKKRLPYIRPNACNPSRKDAAGRAMQGIRRRS